MISTAQKGPEGPALPAARWGGWPKWGLLAWLVSLAGYGVARLVFSYEDATEDGSGVRVVRGLAALVLLPLAAVSAVGFGAVGVWRRERWWLVALAACLVNGVPAAYIVFRLLW